MSAEEDYARRAAAGLPFDGLEIIWNGESFTVISYDPATHIITARTRPEPHDRDGVDTRVWTMLDSEVEVAPTIVMAHNHWSLAITTGSPVSFPTIAGVSVRDSGQEI
jgi:hypothetical protein